MACGGLKGLQVVEMILDLGADINYCPPWGRTVLYEAVMCLDVAMVGLLLKRGPTLTCLSAP